jgi:hypothetical protein
MFCRYKCKTFGQRFQSQSNGSFYDIFTIGCQADATWTLKEIPDPCVCKYNVSPQNKCYDPLHTVTVGGINIHLFIDIFITIIGR